MRWARLRSQLRHAAVLYAPMLAVLVAVVVVTYSKSSSTPNIINHEMQKPIAPVEEPGNNQK